MVAQATTRPWPGGHSGEQCRHSVHRAGAGLSDPIDGTRSSPSTLSAAFHAIRAALPQMLERKWGRIINIASTHGLVASVHKVAYVAAKHGILGITKVVALETATTGVTCNAICPGWVLTPLVQKQIDDMAKTRVDRRSARQNKSCSAEKQPSLEFATPEQIGGVAAFLCSDAAAQIRGIGLPVDGGWTAQ